MLGDSLETTHPDLRDLWQGPFGPSAARMFLDYYQTMHARSRWNSNYPSVLKSLFGKSIAQVASTAVWLSLLRYHSTCAMIDRARQMLAPLAGRFVPGDPATRDDKPGIGEFEGVKLYDPATETEWDIDELLVELVNLEDRIAELNDVEMVEQKEISESKPPLPSQESDASMYVVNGVVPVYRPVCVAQLTEDEDWPDLDKVGRNHLCHIFDPFRWFNYPDPDKAVTVEDMRAAIDLVDASCLSTASMKLMVQAHLNGVSPAKLHGYHSFDEISEAYVKDSSMFQSDKNEELTSDARLIAKILSDAKLKGQAVNSEIRRVCACSSIFLSFSFFREQLGRGYVKASVVKAAMQEMKQMGMGYIVKNKGGSISFKLYQNHLHWSNAQVINIKLACDRIGVNTDEILPGFINIYNQVQDGTFFQS